MSPRTTEAGGEIRVNATAMLIPPHFDADLFFELAASLEAKPHTDDLLGCNGVPVINRDENIIYTGSAKTVRNLIDLGCGIRKKPFSVFISSRHASA